MIKESPSEKTLKGASMWQMLPLSTLGWWR